MSITCHDSCDRGQGGQGDLERQQSALTWYLSLLDQLMRSSPLACCHVDFFKEQFFFFLLMEDNRVTFQLQHIAIINGTPFLLGSLEVSVAQENEEGVREGSLQHRGQRGEILRNEDCKWKAHGPKWKVSRVTEIFGYNLHCLLLIYLIALLVGEMKTFFSLYFSGFQPFHPMHT